MRRPLRWLAWCFCVLVVAAVLAQRFLPLGDGSISSASPGDDRPKSAYPDALRHVQAAVTALRAGDLQGMSQVFQEHDLVSDLPVAVKSGDLKEADAAMIRGLSGLSVGQYREVYDRAFSCLQRKDAAGLTDLADANQLLALVFLRLHLPELARRHADAASQAVAADAGARPGIASLRDTLRELPGGRYDAQPREQARIELLRAAEPAAPQPLIVVWQKTAGDDRGKFVGALAVERAAGTPPPDRSYQVVFRDLCPPALVLLECGPDSPNADDLVNFAAQFRSEGPDADAGPFGLLHIEMQSLYYLQADIAPLAAQWRARFPGADRLLDQQVEQPLRARRAWQWESKGRYAAGRQQPPQYEIEGYVNRETQPPAGRQDGPDRLEHAYFTVGNRADHAYLASYRLVSERVKPAERLYFIERVCGRRATVLEVLTAPPGYAELREKVLGWLNQRPAGT